MPIDLTDLEIAALLEERKVLPADFQKKVQRRVSRLHHQRADIDFNGESGGRYRLMLRQSELNPFDFSAILGYFLPHTTRLFRLQRYNGRHSHQNKIEGTTVRGFHIHTATERYQLRGGREDAYAEETYRFSTLDQAIKCLVLDTNCVFGSPDNPDQTELFGGVHGAR